MINLTEFYNSLPVPACGTKIETGCYDCASKEECSFLATLRKHRASISECPECGGVLVSYADAEYSIYYSQCIESCGYEMDDLIDITIAGELSFFEF